jgi:hypothetical protein
VLSPRIEVPRRPPRNPALAFLHQPIFFSEKYL